MSHYFKKSTLVLVLILIISLCLPGNINTASAKSVLPRATFEKKLPTNAATGLDPAKVKLEWTAASNVFRYVYCYYSSDVPSNVCNLSDKATWISNGTSTSVQLPALIAGKTYYWQVGAKLHDNSFIYGNGSLTSKWSFVTGTGSGGVGEGIYDNSHSNWVFTGGWIASTYTGTELGPYNKTYKESKDIPDYATFTFTGSRAALYYTQEPERGVMNIYMDNSTTPIVLNQSGPLTWQKVWMSDPLTSGVHTIKLVYVSGKAVNIDAIQIYAQADGAAPAQINPSAVSGMNAGTVTLQWTAVGDDGSTGTASSYLIRYSKLPISDETAWANATAVTTGVPTPKAAGQAEIMTVSGLTPGQTYYFAIRAQDEQFNLGVLSTSSSAVAKIFAPAGAGLYDDTDPAWAYAGNWYTWNGSGPQNNTMHYTNATGASATFRFQAPAKFILYFQASSSRSNILISVDGGAAILVNAYSATNLWRQTYTSDMYSDTDAHTVTITTPGDGKYIDVDAIRIVGPPAPQGAGLYDDTDSNWVYTGNWYTWNGTGPLNGTMHYTNATGASATFEFQAPAKFILYFQKSSNRGNILVSVDGGEPVLVNAYNATSLWQQTYTSDMYSDTDAHTVTITTPGDDKYIDVDAIQIVSPRGPGIYDDTDPAWAYTDNWYTWNGTGPLNGTMHYTNATGASATFRFQAPAKFILYFQKSSNRGNILVSVDGGEPVLVNAYSATNLWQQTYTSDMYSDTGAHTVTITTPGDGKYIDVDAIQIVGLPSPQGAGIYDDTNSAWAYTGNWYTWNGTGPLNGTMHYTNATETSASFRFQAPAKFILYFQASANRSNILVSVDGGAPVLVNAYNIADLWQQTYISNMYSDTNAHTVTITTPGDGKYIDIDAIMIMNP